MARFVEAVKMVEKWDALGCSKKKKKKRTTPSSPCGSDDPGHFSSRRRRIPQERERRGTCDALWLCTPFTTRHRHTQKKRREEEEEKSEFSFFLARRTDEVIITNRIHPAPHKERRTNQIETKKIKTPKFLCFSTNNTRAAAELLLTTLPVCARIDSIITDETGKRRREKKYAVWPSGVEGFFF